MQLSRNKCTVSQNVYLLKLITSAFFHITYSSYMTQQNHSTFPEKMLLNNSRNHQPNSVENQNFSREGHKNVLFSPGKCPKRSDRPAFPKLCSVEPWGSVKNFDNSKTFPCSLSQTTRSFTRMQPIPCSNVCCTNQSETQRKDV